MTEQKMEMQLQERENLYIVSEKVRNLISQKNYEESENVVCEAMQEYPHTAEPHNLMGIIAEEKGDHVLAMKHFRAAWALDPTYIPARENLDRFGRFGEKGTPLFDNDDLDSGEHAKWCHFHYNYKKEGVKS